MSDRSLADWFVGCDARTISIARFGNMSAARRAVAAVSVAVGKLGFVLAASLAWICECTMRRYFLAFSWSASRANASSRVALASTSLPEFAKLAPTHTRKV